MSAEPLSPTAAAQKSSFASVELFRQKAYKIATDTPSYLAPYIEWYDKVVDTAANLSDCCRAFQLEVLLHQFDTEVAKFLGTELPPALQLSEHERPTNIAYNARIRELIATGLIKEGEFEIIPLDADPNTQKVLPQETFVPALPALDILPDDNQKTTAKDTIKIWVDGWKKSELVQEIIHDLDASRKLLAELRSDDGWLLASEEKGGLKTFYRQEPGTAIYSFKVSSMVKCPLMDLFKLIYEVELFPLWFPMMADNAREVHEWNRFSKAVVSQVKAIWPFANRELLLAAKGIDNSPNGSVLINLRDLPETDPHWFPVTSGAVRCKMLHGGFILVPTSKETTQVSFFSNVDPALSLPSSLMNYVTGKMVGMLIPIMQDNAPKTKGEKSKWYESVKSHAAVYDDIEAKMRLFFPDYDKEEEKDEKKK